MIHGLLASGAVQLSTLELVRDYLTDGNHAELLTAVANKGKREVKALLAARFPQPDVPARIQRSRIEPLSEHRFKVEFSASAELVEKLELCRDLMSHAHPGGELEIVVERALDLLLAELQATRLAQTKRPRPANRARSASARITSDVRRRVFERDGLRCTFVSPDGRRCEARAFLQLDHVEPRALGGSNDAGNLRVRCGAHNRLWAEQVFGRERVEQCKHLRQQKCQSDAFDKARTALRRLGYPSPQVERAVATVERRCPNAENVEQVLRDALEVLAKAAA